MRGEPGFTKCGRSYAQVGGLLKVGPDCQISWIEVKAFHSQHQTTIPFLRKKWLRQPVERCTEGLSVGCCIDPLNLQQGRVPFDIGSWIVAEQPQGHFNTACQ